jgi:DNA-binding transcriptional MerR regulator
MPATPATLTIGDFSRATLLTIKTLRHYHDTGVLGAAEVDPRSGYRRYLTSQIPQAQMIKRFRETSPSAPTDRPPPLLKVLL